MTNNLIITIGRQCGSGGKMIGELLAEKMGVKCYDKELLSMAAKHSGLCEELFEKHDERPTSSFLYSLVMDSYSMGYTASGYSDMPINHKIFLAQFDTIKSWRKRPPASWLDGVRITPWRTTPMWSAYSSQPTTMTR